MKLSDIKKITIAGAGVMGGSMAQIFAEKGYNVCIYNRSEKGINRCKEMVALNRETIVNQGICSVQENKEIMDRIVYSTSMEESFSDTDFVIESIAEDLEIKKVFLKEVSSLVKEDVLITTNTSGLSITKIAEAVEKPQLFAGFHWVNPPHIIPLVEIISGEKTIESTTDLIFEVAKDIGKEPIKVKDVPGFCLNRFQFAVLREALYMVEEGIVSKEDVDKVFKYGLGIRYASLGPFEIADFGGLDTFTVIADYLMADLCNEYKAFGILKQSSENGRYGVKNGKGIYDYGEGKGDKLTKERDEKYFSVVKALYGDKK